MSLLNNIAYFLTIKPRMMYLKKLLPEAKIRPAGSRYVCNPPHYGTDVDFLVYSGVPIHGKLTSMGYRETPWKDYFGQEDGKFRSWRRRSVNLVVTTDLKYAESFDTGAYLAKKYNLRRKAQRVFVHEVLRGGYKQPEIERERRKHAGRDFSRGHGELLDLLAGFASPYGYALMKAYRAKHRLEEFT